MWKHHSPHPQPKHKPQTFPFPKSDSSWRYGVGKMVRTWANKPDYNLEQLQILLTTFFASNAIEPITMAYPPLFKLAFVCPQAHCQTNLTHHHNKMRSSYKYTIDMPIVNCQNMSFNLYPILLNCSMNGSKCIVWAQRQLVSQPRASPIFARFSLLDNKTIFILLLH